tara:strand:- start:505 stop:681 length:177 start_codon:yes stop_codon:yes gene_type:complete
MKANNIQIQSLSQTLDERLATLKDMQSKNVKFQHQQGTKEDIWRLKREIAELRELKNG